MGRRLSHAILLLFGLAVAAGGIALLYRSMAATEDGAEAAAARMFRHYAAAATASDYLHWRRELLEALAAGRQALTENPARADVSLQLAAIEFWLFGAGDAVYAPLRLSFVTAPRELWIIERRIGLDLELVADAAPDLQADISRDIQVLGEPFRDTGNYRILARAAAAAGPLAAARVRKELGPDPPYRLQLFDAYLAGNAPRQSRAP